MPPPVRAAAAFTISYRAKTDEDRDFIEALYASTREEELGLSGWPEDFRRKFIAQQQLAQNRHLEMAHPAAEWLIVLRNGNPIGRLYVEDRGSDIWLVDIALMPQSRGFGIGGAIIRDLLDQGRDSGRPVGLTGFKHNPARRLYERLGFVTSRETDVYDEMIWRAEGGGTPLEQANRPT